ncbi:Dna2/Cas4 domain-containing protein [Dysgonomonas sp. 216]|uniref:UvrD-helicase domain-containing protein n=1 Tax=Dysgonomonas sp. 216 TaxID=2302934 RepID=UPI0013D2BC98|nr:UvrD-helicase domain-containing protein [Dysgonomonas sp. 216]NDW17409.1 Dna2/Cas4 domain-containing protein [Dysgonomonas sp. 216]
MPKHESSDSANLLVYRASAGSGKTHQLTYEYLRLLFASPFAYRHILAVTFTNKATDEMKSRIVEELSKLASGQKSDYISELVYEYAETEERIREKAKRTLINILHDYSAFSVSTIDRFFQQTMRAFTREIGLGGGYNVELDTTKVLREAIDSMLSDLEKSENKRLLDWLLRFSEEKIENGETWNVKNDIQSLSSEIFKESYKAFSDQLQKDIEDKTALDEYKSMLVSYIREYEKRSQQLGEKGLNIMDRFGLLPADFKNGSRSPFTNFVTWANGEIKMPNATFTNLYDNIGNWYTAKTDTATKGKIEEAYASGLNDCVKEVISHYENSFFYQTAYEINRYYFALGILSDVDSKIREYTAENNLMLISDTTELLSKIVQGTDSPFIYEKTGTYVNHYMIDEFQDTSGMQWANFRPLLNDSLATGNRNLIVGDVKQSIYRWRNSDWKLLDTQLDVDFGSRNIDHRLLGTNWRSEKNIVDFNNAVFGMAAQLLQSEFNDSLEDVRDNATEEFFSKIVQAYSGLYQHYAPHKKDNGGHVKVEFIDTADNSDWQATVLEQLPHTIEDLQDRGYALKDIAILVRTKKEGADVADCLLRYKGEHPDSKYKYDIISDEALFVRNSKSIKLIISLLKYLSNPLDMALRSLAIYEYYKFKDGLTSEMALQKHFAKGDFPEDIRAELEQIREMPLYEMVEGVFEMFHEAMEENENVYIQTFLDMVLDYAVRQSSDLDSFLQWWDDSGSTKTIFTPDGQDAIRIMTIHKSKGLGFEAVLIPFCNWEIDHKLTTILWCRPQTEPFDKLHLVPVKYSQKLKNTIFAYDYFNEKLHAHIDNLNVLYVAFTRAKKDLIAFSPRPTKDKINNISSLLWGTLNGIGNTLKSVEYIPLQENLDEESGVFELGVSYEPYLKSEEDGSGEIKIGTLSSVAFDERLRLKLNNKYFFSDKGQREYGTLMHEIISKVKSLDEVTDIVEQYSISGDITQDEKTKVIDMIVNFLIREEVAEWYSGKYRVLNEVEILQPNGVFIRPDRVMINNDEVIVVDYKFGGKESKKYHKQVKYYMAQILKMGYEKVSGFICYVTLDKIVPVE